MSYCPDCGCKMYNGVCTNCHEEMYIAEQYNELDMPIPDTFREILNDVQVQQSHYEQSEDVKLSCLQRNN